MQRLLLIGLATPLLLPAQSRQFPPDQNRTVSSVVPVGRTCSVLQVADLNGDGLGDAISLGSDSTSTTSRNLRLHFQTVGAWNSPTAIASTSNPSAAAIADVDGDGDLDLVIGPSTPTTASLAILRNDGSGNFTAAANPPAIQASNVQAIATGDFDGDGDLDLVVGTSPDSSQSPTSPYLRYFRNLGGGSFAASVSALPVISSPGCRPAVADFDGDGDLDVLVVMPGAAPQFLRNQGGFFTSVPSFLPAGLTGYARVAATDVDGDGDVDAVVAGSNIQLLRNTGSGFAAPVTVQNGSVLDLAAGDPDGDGDPDLVVRTALEMIVLRNDGTGAFAPDAPLTGGIPQAATFGRVSPDAVDDLVTAWSRPVLPGVVYYGAPNGPAADPQALRGFHPSLPRVGSTALGDFDADGWTDIAMCVQDASSAVRIAVYLNRGLDGFRESFASGSAGVFAAHLLVVDLDGDGDQDLAVNTSGSLSSALYSLLNDGAGNFGPVTLTSVFPDAAAFGDVDGDGDQDLIASSTFEVTVWLNNGAGGFTSAGAIAGTFGGQPHACRMADFDGDGDLDVLTGKGGTNALMLNNGSGGFTPSPFPWATIPSGMTVGDCDGDGDVDVLNWDVNGVRLFINNGQASFTNETATRLPPYLPVGSPPYVDDVTLFDADGDGDVDLFLARFGAELLWLNNGAGSFIDGTQVLWTPTSIQFGGSYLRSGAADFDRDGDLDVQVGEFIVYNHQRQLSTLAVPTPGGSIQLRLSLDPAKAQPGSLAITALGFSPRAPLTVPGIDGEFQIVVAGTLPLVVPPTPAGTFDLTLALPPNPLFRGTDLWMQGLFLSPLWGAGTTNAIHERIR